MVVIVDLGLNSVLIKYLLSTIQVSIYASALIFIEKQAHIDLVYSIQLKQ